MFYFEQSILFFYILLLKKYNNLVLGPVLFIEKNKLYLLFFYLKILYATILAPTSLATIIIASYYCYFCTDLNINFYILALIFFRAKVLYIIYDNQKIVFQIKYGYFEY